MSGKTRNMEDEWTKENLQKLLATLKSSIPQGEREGAYTKGLRAVDWTKVAFPPFSPEQCKEKWTEFMQKMRKIRTLTELIDEAQHVVSNPSPNSKIHPKRPKRPSPPNALYFEEKWPKFQEKHPNKKTKKLFRNLMRKYNTLPEEKKAVYEERFQIQLDQYNKRMKEFRKEYLHPSANNKNKNKRKSGESTEGPPLKPPSNGYSLFCKENGSSIEAGSAGSCVRAWAQAWRAFTEPQREEFNTRCKEMKTQYAVEMEKYISTLNGEQLQQVVKKFRLKSPSKSSEEKRKSPEKFPGEPKMPARSGNTLFIKNQMKILKRDFPNQRRRLSEINQRWQVMSHEERNTYNKKVSKNLSEYSRELKKWFKTLSPEKRVNYKKNNPRKCKYLDLQVNYEELKPEPSFSRASDSEDEELEDSNSDEEPVVERRELEEDEEIIGDDITFELF